MTHAKKKQPPRIVWTDDEVRLVRLDVESYHLFGPFHAPVIAPKYVVERALNNAMGETAWVEAWTSPELGHGPDQGHPIQRLCAALEGAITTIEGVPS